MLQQGLETAIASDSDFNTALVASRLTVVQFSMAGCELCVRVGPAVSRLSSIYTDVSFLQADVQTCQGMAALHKVSATPTFLFHHDGIWVGRYEGVEEEALEEEMCNSLHVEKNPRDSRVPNRHVDQAHLITTVNPIFGLAGSLIRLVLNHVDDEDIRTLKLQFGTIQGALDTLSQQINDALSQIQIGVVDSQYGPVVERLQNQFRMYMEMLEAQPMHRDSKKNDFMESYKNDLEDDQHLNSLYNGVLGTTSVFGRPILDVYLRHSGGGRHTMERLCTRLRIVFCMGLVAHMGNTAIVGGDEDKLMRDWSKNMIKVENKMKEALERCG